MNKTKPLFVTADEIRDDWGVSKAMAYEIIKRMSLQLRKVRNERWQFLRRINHGQLLSGTRIGRVIHVRKERKDLRPSMRLRNMNENFLLQAEKDMTFEQFFELYSKDNQHNIRLHTWIKKEYMVRNSSVSQSSRYLPENIFL